MTMVYVRNEEGATFALPRHIIEDFEVSNTRLESGARSPQTAPIASDGSAMSALFGATEIDITVGELQSILGLGNAPYPAPSHGLCAGLDSPSNAGFSINNDLPMTLCAGLSGYDGQGSAYLNGPSLSLCAGLAGPNVGDQWVQFLTDPRLQHVRLRVRANDLCAFLYGNGA